MFVLLFLLIPVLSSISAKPLHSLVHDISDDTWSSRDEDFLNAEVVLENLIEEISKDKNDLAIEDFPQQPPGNSHDHILLYRPISICRAQP
ncbi:unnamed protein product [Auanema sp. JU1783]|nr:unnamed protein product [Auanema sp. JU1783]